jgi:hypothetical protein
MMDAPAIVFKGGVYVLASITVTHHTDQNGQPGFYGPAIPNCCA